MIDFGPEPRAAKSTESFCGRLLMAAWDSIDSPMHLRGDVPLSDLAHSRFLVNTRHFLAALEENDGAPVTATGNLTRALVGQIFERLDLDAHWRDSIRHIHKVVNEPDVWPLHLVRVVSQIANLVARRNKRFRLTQKGARLLPEIQAGSLFRELFLAFFWKFDLAYDFRFRDVPGIQETMPVIFWRLDSLIRDWTPVRGLAPQVLLPRVHEQVRAAMISEYDTEEWILSGYVLKPLLDFGLIESKSPTRWGLGEKDHIRVTGLWQKFICFSSS